MAGGNPPQVSDLIEFESKPSCFPAESPSVLVTFWFHIGVWQFWVIWMTLFKWCWWITFLKITFSICFWGLLSGCFAESRAMLDVGWICELCSWLFLHTPDLSNLNNYLWFSSYQSCICVFLESCISYLFFVWICELCSWLFLHTPDLSNLNNSYGRDQV